MGCNSQVVYLGRGCVHLWFWRWGPVTWCYHPSLLLHSWVYCGGDIARKWVYRFVLWFGCPFESRFLLPMWVKYVYCVRARDLGTKNKIIDGQPTWRMSECRVRFLNCGRSFNSPAMYRSALKKVEVSGSVFSFYSHFFNTFTDTVNLSRLPLWMNWYRYYIVYGDLTQQCKRLVEACPCCCRVVMLERVLLIHFVMKCDIWTIFLSRACSNGVRSISSQSAIWVIFLSAQYWSSRCLEI